MKDPMPAGIDTDLKNRCSRTAFAYARRSFANREGRMGAPIPRAAGSFSQLIDFGAIRIAMASDGIGTKVELAERTGIYDTLGYDLVAMVVDDLAANGIEPVNLSNVLDVDRLDPAIVEALMRGLYEAAAQAGVAVTGGEIAELGSRIGGWGEGMHFNWCGTGIGVLPEGQTVIDGSEVERDDAIVALRSRGFRSNGFSLVRRILEERLGADWHEASYDDRQTWGQLLLTPSLIYTPLINALRSSGFSLHGIAHVTGGGIGDNLGRVLQASGLGAELDGLFEPHPVMLALQGLGSVDEATAYRLWNMGNGMLLVVPPRQATEVVGMAGKHGFASRIAGRITSTPVIRIHSLGREPRVLEYPAAARQAR